jgi:pimeloyl-ACP methyl ester carboxylesterase
MSKVKLYSGRDALEATLEIRRKSDAFLVCHGFGGSMYEPEESSVMNDLVEMGYTSMIVSHKTGRRPDLIFPEQIRQLVDAVTYLTKKVKVGRVHLFGISMGASNAISVASVDDRIASVAASSGIMDCGLWLRERWGADFDKFISLISKIEISELNRPDSSPQLFEVSDLLKIPSESRVQHKIKGRTTKVSVRTIRSLLTYKPILSVPGIRNKPAFFFHGTDDRLVPHKNTIQMFNAAKTQKYKMLVPGGDHGMILLDPIRKKILSMYLDDLKAANLLEKPE